MELKELADIGQAQEIAASDDPVELSNALQSILNSSRRFTHYDIVRGGMGSVRLFLQQPFGESIDLPESSSEAGSIARELIQLRNEGGARYPDKPCADREQGWRIRKIEIQGKPAAIAEAAWV